MTDNIPNQNLDQIQNRSQNQNQNQDQNQNQNQSYTNNPNPIIYKGYNKYGNFRIQWADGSFKYYNADGSRYFQPMVNGKPKAAYLSFGTGELRVNYVKPINKNTGEKLFILKGPKYFKSINKYGAHFTKYDSVRYYYRNPNGMIYYSHGSWNFKIEPKNDGSINRKWKRPSRDVAWIPVKNSRFGKWRRSGRKVGDENKTVEEKSVDNVLEKRNENQIKPAVPIVNDNHVENLVDKMRTVDLNEKAKDLHVTVAVRHDSGYPQEV